MIILMITSFNSLCDLLQMESIDWITCYSRDPTVYASITAPVTLKWMHTRKGYRGNVFVVALATDQSVISTGSRALYQ